MRMTMVVLLLLGTVRAADPVVPSVKAASKAEPYLMLPEPRAMRSTISRPHAGAQRTVFSPARQTADGAVRALTKEEFTKLGISWDTFLDRSEAAADRRLATMQPELKKDAAGRVVYAVYRGEDPIFACLLIAPSLANLFKNILGPEVWLVTPDRHSLFVFPPRKEAIEEFASDLKERFEENPFAASDEIFAAKPGEALRTLGSFQSSR